jgi:predicted DNA binding protein
LAAAVVLLLGGGLVWQSGQRTAGHASAAALAPASLDLNALSADQLRAVLNAVDQPLDLEASGSEESGLDDLTPRELRRLLHALEG